MSSVGPAEEGPWPTGPQARWARVQELFHAAADLPADAQQAYLDRECASGPGAHRRGEGAAQRRQPEWRCPRPAGGRRGLGHPLPRLHPSASGWGPTASSACSARAGWAWCTWWSGPICDSRAAIKVLRDAWVSPERRERFAAEQRTLAQLVHPAIARLHDAGTLPDGTPWFVMEYVEGVPLTQYCREHALDGERAPARCSAASATPSSTPTATPSSTATSSPPTSWSPPTGR